MKPVESAQQSLLDFDLGESSDDSDFRIEDHCEESDDDSVDSNDVERGIAYVTLHLIVPQDTIQYVLCAGDLRKFIKIINQKLNIYFLHCS